MSKDRTTRLSADIATVVRGLLAEDRVSIKEFSGRIDLPMASVYRWLNDGGNFDVAALEAMAGGLGMDPVELVSRAMLKRAERDLPDLNRRERAALDQAIVRPGRTSARIADERGQNRPKRVIGE